MRLTKITSGSKVVGYEKVYNFREIEDPEHFNAYDYDVLIELDHCPFCGNTPILNRSTLGWYGNCMICGAEGPKHWDWIKAARMWNDRSLKTVMECKDINEEYLKEHNFDFSRILPEQLENAGIKLEEEENNNETD